VDESRGRIVTEVFRNLKIRGFRVSDPDLTGSICFDMMARRDNEKYFLKVLYNVDTIRKDAASELITLAKVTGSAAVVIGERTGAGKLEHGLVYYRHTIPIMSPETFVDYVDGEKPYVFSGPGGFYVSLDGEKMRSAREEEGFSIGYVSGKIGTSRRSISLYESGTAATVEVFLRLCDLLERDLRRSIDLLNVVRSIEPPHMLNSIDDTLLRTISNKIVGSGYTMNIMRKSPFDAMAGNGTETLIMGLLELIGRDYERASAMRNIADILEDDLLVVSRNHTEKTQISGCPVVNVKELVDYCDRGELGSLVERKKRGL
jgi:putative transcriptional regulator